MIHESIFSKTKSVAGLCCDNDVIQHADVKKIPALPPDNAVHLAFRAFGGSLIRDIGQNVLVKTAVSVEISMAAAVISCFQEDIGWTKRVGKKAEIC